LAYAKEFQMKLTVGNPSIQQIQDILTGTNTATIGAHLVAQRWTYYVLTAFVLGLLFGVMLVISEHKIPFYKIDEWEFIRNLSFLLLLSIGVLKIVFYFGKPWNALALQKVSEEHLPCSALSEAIRLEYCKYWERELEEMHVAFSGMQTLPAENQYNQIALESVQCKVRSVLDSLLFHGFLPYKEYERLMNKFVIHIPLSIKERWNPYHTPSKPSPPITISEGVKAGGMDG
jgi:hypothetical protein